MRTRAVIGAVLVCAIAWLLAVVVWPRASARDRETSATAVSLGIDPASIVGVVASVGDRRVEASRLGEAWLVESSEGGRWRGDDSAILRAVRGVTAGLLRESPEPVETSASFELIARDGRRVSVELADSAAGGFVGARVRIGPETRGVLAPAEVLEATRAGANGAWRSPALAERIEPGVSALRVSAGDSEVRLVRTGGRWAFEGSTARADGPSVEELIARVQGLRAAAWLESADGPAVATIEMTTRRPSGEVWIQKLDVVGQADLAGELVSIRATRRDPGDPAGAGWSVVAAVPAEAIRGLPANAGPLLSRTSVAAAASDVVRVAVLDREVLRESLGWRHADGALVGVSEAARVQAFVQLVCSAEGRIVSRPNGEAIEARVWALGDPEGVRLDIYVEDDRVVVWDGTAARAYAGATVWGAD